MNIPGVEMAKLPKSRQKCHRTSLRIGCSQLKGHERASGSIGRCAKASEQARAGSGGEFGDHERVPGAAQKPLSRPERAPAGSSAITSGCRALRKSL